MKKKIIDDIDDLELIKAFPHISIIDLEEILEHLKDKKYLNSRGEVLKFRLWKRFIKK